MELQMIKGIGKKRVKQLNENNIHTAYNLITTFPKRYIIKKLSRLDEANEKEYAYFEGIIISKPSLFFIRSNLSKLSFRMKTEDQEITVSVFNQKYLIRTLYENTNIVVYGKLNDNKQSMNVQKIYHAKNFSEGYEPVYNLQDLNDKTFLKLVKSTLENFNNLQEYLPLHILKKHNLITLTELVKTVHTPQTSDEYHRAVDRLKYEEIFLHQTRMQYIKYQEKSKHKTKKIFDQRAIDHFISTLAFKLTKAQNTTLITILNDLKSDSTMYRMLQGDTGSGKTLVAALSAYAVILSGYQVAFMAPTEILARQHYKTLKALFLNTEINLAFLSNSMPKEKISTLQSQLSQGKIDLIIGTHKLFSTDTVYHNLGLNITDEQHRFGVNQRKNLKQKGTGVESLYLSATPIPRTLGKTLYGNMDISILNERPESRLPTKTKAIPHQKQAVILNRLQNVLQKGEQVYVVAPTIEPTEQFPYSVDELYKHYLETFPTYNIAKVHGKMDRDVQENILLKFKRGGYDILIATTIIEVGIDVPNATTILIYHAEKFGFSQLHQLRGRVGRGSVEGACILFYTPSEQTMSRMNIMEKTTDGFKLSEYDLEYRGHGDLIGTIQSGYLPFKYIAFPKDNPLLHHANADAKEIIKDLIDNKETVIPLKKKLDKMYSTD